LQSINKYLVVDGMLSGTGIRDAVNGGYINLANLDIPENLINRINLWLSRYADAHFMGFNDEKLTISLDLEGVQIRNLLRLELKECKIEYFSSAKMCNIT